MGTYSTKKPREVLGKLRESSMVKIYISSCPESICALYILTAILQREVMKYEVNIMTVHNPNVSEEYKVFIDLHNQEYKNGLYFGNQKTENLDLITSDTSICRNKSYAVILMYEMAMSLNIVDSLIIWPLIIVLDFNKHFYFKKFEPLYVDNQTDDSTEEEDIKGDVCCSKCSDFYRMIVIDAKKLNISSSLDKIFIKYDVDLLFISNSDLFSSISNDINFILEKRLFITKKNVLNQDSKVKEFFAHLGISRAEAKERFSEIEYSTKKRLRKNLRCTFMFYKQIGYEILISSLENYYLIYYFLLNMPAYSVTNLKSCKLLDITESVSLYLNLINLVKNNYYKVKSIHDIKYLILNQKIKYKNRAMFLNLLLMFFKVAFKRLKKDTKMMIIYEDLDNHSIIVSDSHTINTYIKDIKFWYMDTFGTSIGLDNSSMRKFYNTLFKKKSF